MHTRVAFALVYQIAGHARAFAVCVRPCTISARVLDSIHTRIRSLKSGGGSTARSETITASNCTRYPRIVGISRWNHSIGPAADGMVVATKRLNPILNRQLAGCAGVSTRSMLLKVSQIQPLDGQGWRPIVESFIPPGSIPRVWCGSQQNNNRIARPPHGAIRKLAVRSDEASDQRRDVSRMNNVSDSMVCGRIPRDGRCWLVCRTRLRTRRRHPRRHI